jgi:flagellar motility protein MotE (MotC chaperone)
MKLRTQILLTFLIVIKLLLGSVFMYRIGLGSFFSDANAIAAEQAKDIEVSAKKDEKRAKEETVDLKYLISKKAEIEKQEKSIEAKRAELLSIQDEINKKIGKLTQLRDEIRSEVAKKKAVEEQKLKHLIKVYSTMKPQSAAELIEKLDIKLAIELMSKMKGDAVGKILSFVKIEKAAEISEGLVNKE